MAEPTATLSTSPVIVYQDAPNDEIDLRPIIMTLVRWWRAIVLVTLAAMVLAAVAILLLRQIITPTYEASADVAIVRVQSDVTFDERFKTTSDNEGTSTNINSRRSGLLALVATGAIAQRVIDQLGDQLNEEEKNPARLLTMVETEAANIAGGRGDSDLIRIIISADSPEKAAAIANTWATAYVQQVNEIYGNVPDEMLRSIETELDAAKKVYTTNQANLEAFIADNRIDELNGKIGVLQQRVNQEVGLIQGYINQRQQTLQWLSSTRALRVQVEQGGEGAARSNMPALQVLKIGVYGVADERLRLEIRDVPEVTQAAMLVDIDGLLGSLQGRLLDLDGLIVAGQAQLESSAAAAVQGVVSSTLPVISEIYAGLRSVKAQLETENARNLQLLQQRDLSWETFKTLSSKVAELSLARAAASSEVRFGAPAVAPEEPIQSISLLLSVIAAGMLAFMGMLVYIFLVEYIGKTALLGKQAAEGV